MDRVFPSEDIPRIYEPDASCTFCEQVREIEATYPIVAYQDDDDDEDEILPNWTGDRQRVLQREEDFAVVDGIKAIMMGHRVDTTSGEKECLEEIRKAFPDKGASWLRYRFLKIRDNSHGINWTRDLDLCLVRCHGECSKALGRKVDEVQFWKRVHTMFAQKIGRRSSGPWFIRDRFNNFPK